MKVYGLMTCITEVTISGVVYTKVGGLVMRLIDPADNNKVILLDPLGTSQN